MLYVKYQNNPHHSHLKMLTDEGRQNKLIAALVFWLMHRKSSNKCLGIFFMEKVMGFYSRLEFLQVTPE